MAEAPVNHDNLPVAEQNHKANGDVHHTWYAPLNGKTPRAFMVTIIVIGVLFLALVAFIALFFSMNWYRELSETMTYAIFFAMLLPTYAFTSTLLSRFAFSLISRKLPTTKFGK